MISDILADALAQEREYKRTSVLDYSKYEYMLRSWENLTEQIIAELYRTDQQANQVAAAIVEKHPMSEYQKDE